MPKGLIAATGMDALTHAIEGEAYPDACRTGNPRDTSVEEI